MAYGLLAGLFLGIRHSYTRYCFQSCHHFYSTETSNFIAPLSAPFIMIFSRYGWLFIWHSKKSRKNFAALKTRSGQSNLFCSYSWRPIGIDQASLSIIILVAALYRYVYLLLFPELGRRVSVLYLYKEKK